MLVSTYNATRAKVRLHNTDRLTHAFHGSYRILRPAIYSQQLTQYYLRQVLILASANITLGSRLLVWHWHFVDWASSMKRPWHVVCDSSSTARYGNYSRTLRAPYQA